MEKRLKRMIVLAVAAVLLGLRTEAQGILEVKNVSDPMDVYTSQNDEAAVMVRCHNSIPLSFTSNMDKSVKPYKVEREASDYVYYIEFPTGNRYRGRVITIYAYGYAPLDYELELEPKQLVTLAVTDPNAMVDAGCYREHRNRGMKEFNAANYKEARDQFVVARQCTDVNEMENERNIALVDTVLYYREAAENAFLLLNYSEAAEFYEHVLMLNPYDKVASNRDAQCRQKFANDCETLFLQAEHYLAEKEMDKARELYQRVVTRGCSKQYLAADRLLAIKSAADAKKTHSRIVTYEWNKDMPIGFSTGSYKTKKAGGFFQMSINTKVFDAMRNDCMYGDNEFPEFNLAFGWTMRIAGPVWIHFGPGATGKMYYGRYQEDMYPEKGYGETDLLDNSKMGTDLTIPRKEPPTEYKNAWRHPNYAFAVAPAVGLTLKYSYFVVRATYQYRWAVNKDLQTFMDKNSLSVGVGVAF